MDAQAVTELKRIADALERIGAILDVMAIEGIVTLPDAPASDN